MADHYTSHTPSSLLANLEALPVEAGVGKMLWGWMGDSFSLNRHKHSCPRGPSG